MRPPPTTKVTDVRSHKNMKEYEVEKKKYIKKKKICKAVTFAVIAFFLFVEIAISVLS